MCADLCGRHQFKGFRTGFRVMALGGRETRTVSNIRAIGVLDRVPGFSLVARRPILQA